MADLVTPAILAINVGCGLATNLAQAGGVRAYRKIAALLARGRPRENHDILKATHAAFVSAMEVMAESARLVAREGNPEDRIAASALTKLCGDPDFRGFRYDGEHFPFDEVSQAIDRMFSKGLRHAGGSDVSDPDVALNWLIVRDLATWGIDLPPALETLFVEGSQARQPWHIIFRVSFAEQVKSNGTAFRILTFERLGELRAMGITLIGEVSGIHDRLDRIEEMLREILRRLPAKAMASILAVIVVVGLLVLLAPHSATDLDNTMAAERASVTALREAAVARDCAEREARLLAEHEGALRNDQRTIIATLEAANSPARAPDTDLAVLAVNIQTLGSDELRWTEMDNGAVDSHASLLAGSIVYSVSPTHLSSEVEVIQYRGRPAVRLNCSSGNCIRMSRRGTALDNMAAVFPNITGRRPSSIWVLDTPNRAQVLRGALSDLIGRTSNPPARGTCPRPPSQPR